MNTKETNAQNIKTAQSGNQHWCTEIFLFPVLLRPPVVWPWVIPLGMLYGLHEQIRELTNANTNASLHVNEPFEFTNRDSGRQPLDNHMTPTWIHKSHVTCDLLVEQTSIWYRYKQ